MKLSLVALSLCFTAIGCSQQDPPGEELSTGSTGTSAPQEDGELGSYYPLISGSRYTYRHVNGQGTVTGLEIVNLSESTYNGRAAMLMADEPDADGQSTDAYIVREGTRTMRIHKEVKTDGVVELLVDYDPGFVRMDDAWTTTDAAGMELSYSRTATDATGSNPLTEIRSHVWRVIAVDEQVTTNAGTWPCIHIRRERSSDRSLEGEAVDLWFAKGVGKVKEHRDSETDGIREELLDVIELGAS